MANTGRYKWDKEAGKMMPAEVVDAKRARTQYRAQSDLPTPTVIHDNIEVQSQADGLWYSSKSALRKSYKHHGVIEVGDARAQTIKPPVKKSKAQRRKEVRDAVRKSAATLGFDTV
jgi:hypothetical protein